MVVAQSKAPIASPRLIAVDSPSVISDDQELTAEFSYRRNHIAHTADGRLIVTPKTHEYRFKTQLKPAKTGLLLIGLGGNNGSTVTGAIIANREKMTWRTRNGEQNANYFGSITQATTVHLGWDGERQVHVPFNQLLPTVHPNNLVIGGWDINDANLYQAVLRAKVAVMLFQRSIPSVLLQVFEPELQDKLRPHLESIVPMPSIYYPDFIASNQESRVNHVIAGKTKQEHLEHIRQDIRSFKQTHGLECVIVLWTANTERFADVRPGLNSTAGELLQSIAKNEPEVAPSHVFAAAAVLEGAHYINGSPQNTLVPGLVELAHQHNVFLGGDDFKSGQTKLKSALVDFLVSSGLKPESIVSYNHLGNNDGKNLSEAAQFRSKEITKSSVVDDMVQGNSILYPDGKKPDHTIVIKYVPFVGDSKRAMDEYISSIFMGGLQTMVIHNTCEDSLLAAPLIIDLAVVTELCSRIQYANKATDGHFRTFHPVLSLLSCMLKAPAVPEGTPVCNALMKQFTTLTKLVCACAGLAADTDIQLEFFTASEEEAMGKIKKKVGKAINGVAINGCHANGVANGISNGIH